MGRTERNEKEQGNDMLYELLTEGFEHLKSIDRQKIDEKGTQGLKKRLFKQWFDAREKEGT